MLCKGDKWIKPSMFQYAMVARLTSTNEALFANGRRTNSRAQKLTNQSTDPLRDWLGLVFTLFRQRQLAAIWAAHMHIVITTHVS
jgi:hypothetical protein